MDEMVLAERAMIQDIDGSAGTPINAAPYVFDWPIPLFLCL
jgi:hypothetical protein